MSNNLFQFYHQNCLNLARSIVLKNSAYADLMNTMDNQSPQYIRQGKTVNQQDLTSWRYYRHLAGDYHELDEKMYVRSLDTLEMIEFSKASLANHRATYRGYDLLGDFHENLVSKYPGQTDLIYGILNPIPYEKSIAANDYDIIHINKTLIEENEHPLLDELQLRIRGNLSRWDVGGYKLTDDLYEPTRMAILAMNLPLMIMAIRQKYVKTIYAHSFHIWQYLGSKRKLDQFARFLTKEQALWLYRNIQWVIDNPGKTDTFEALVENMLSKRTIPLYKYLLKTDNTDIINFNPKNRADRIQLNLPDMDYQSVKDKIKIDELMGKEVPTALNNLDNLIEDTVKTEKALKWSKYSNLETKVLESHVEDYSAISPYPIEHILLNTWVYAACNRRYLPIISITNPFTAELMTMSPQEALVLFTYAWMEWNSTARIHIPTLSAYQILPANPPDWAAIERKVNKRYDLSLYIRYLKDIYPVMGTIVSTETFDEYCLQVQKFKLALRNIWSFESDMRLSGELRRLMSRIHRTEYCKLTDDPNKTFVDYFKERGWSVLGLSRENYKHLATSILTKVTGADLHVGLSIGDIQQAMIKIMERLSSYSVQFISSITGEETIVTDPYPVKQSTIWQYENDFKHTYIGNSRLFRRWSFSWSRDYLGYSQLSSQLPSHTYDTENAAFEPSLKSKGHIEYRNYLGARRADITTEHDFTDMKTLDTIMWMEDGTLYIEDLRNVNIPDSKVPLFDAILTRVLRTPPDLTPGNNTSNHPSLASLKPHVYTEHYSKSMVDADGNLHLKGIWYLDTRDIEGEQLYTDLSTVKHILDMLILPKGPIGTSAIIEFDLLTRTLAGFNYPTKRFGETRPINLTELVTTNLEGFDYPLTPYGTTPVLTMADMGARKYLDMLEYPENRAGRNRLIVTDLIRVRPIVNMDDELTYDKLGTRGR